MPVVAVGAVAAVIAALMALLLLYGAAALAKMVANLVPNWHIPGLGNIRSAVLGAANSALRTVAGWLDSAVGNVAHWILAPWHIMNAIYAKLISVGHSIYHAILAARLLAHTIYKALLHFIAVEFATAIHLARYLYAQAIAFAHAVESTLLHFIAARVDSLIHLIDVLHAAAIAYAASIYSTLLHFVGERVSSLENLIGVSVAGALAEAHALYEQALAYARAIAHTTATAVVGALVTDVTNAVHADWVKITDEVAALEGVIATDLPDIGALVRAIPRAIPTDLAEVITGALAIEIPMIRFLRECGVPNCKNLGGFGKALQDLFGLAEGVALIGLIEAMVHDPQGTANETVTVLDGALHDTVNTFRDLIGA